MTTTENNVVAQAGAEPMREAVARAICKACEESPDHKGDARGNQWRWQDYLHVADAAIAQVSPRATADVERELSDEEIHAILDALPISYWDVPQDATVMFARAILATTKPGS